MYEYKDAYYSNIYQLSYRYMMMILNGIHTKKYPQIQVITTYLTMNHLYAATSTCTTFIGNNNSNITLNHSVENMIIFPYTSQSL